MIRWIFALLLLGASVGYAAQGDDWRRSPKPVREAVKATVEAQLAAIRENDFPKAYEYASAGIRARFAPAVFAAMIRRGYPALARHIQADVGAVRDDGENRATISVTVADRLNRSTHYRYRLIKEAAGWRIEGVVEEEISPREVI